VFAILIYTNINFIRVTVCFEKSKGWFGLPCVLKLQNGRKNMAVKQDKMSHIF
jgi:hypothetical protein